jgi:hypothetical protein
MNWDQPRDIPAESYSCGYCGRYVASAKGYSGGGVVNRIYICPQCDRPTYFGSGIRVPEPVPGAEVASLPSDVGALYRETRSSAAAGAHTASVLASRKLLMNIAVNQGAHENKRFIEYVDYLADNGYIPPNGRGWVDHIRRRGNEATHEIHLMASADSAELIGFLEMLLKFIYEFPGRIPTGP